MEWENVNRTCQWLLSKASWFLVLFGTERQLFWGNVYKINELVLFPHWRNVWTTHGEIGISCPKPFWLQVLWGQGLHLNHCPLLGSWKNTWLKIRSRYLLNEWIFKVPSLHSFYSTNLSPQMSFFFFINFLPLTKCEQIYVCILYIWTFWCAPI